MKIELYIFLLVGLIWNVNASLKPLTDEFFKKNNLVQSNELDYEIQDETLRNFEAVFDWNLDLRTYSKNSKPIGLFSFQSQVTKETGVSAIFSKYFQSGTEFSYGQYLTKLDLSEWTSTVPADLGNTPYSTYSLLSLKQYLWADSFGRSFRASYDKMKSLSEANKLNLKLSDQIALFEFISKYINSKKVKTLSLVAIGAKERAQIRKDLVEKKLKDGVSKKIDLYQAELALLSQKENIEVTKSNYISTEEMLSKQIQRLVNEEDVKIYDLDKFKLMESIKGSVEDNLSISSLEKYREVAAFDFKNADNSNAPKVYLEATLRTNTYNKELSQALSDSYPGGENRESTISLNMSIPLGMNKTSSAKNIKRAELLKSDITLINIKKELELESKLIQKRIDLQKANTKSANKRLNLAKKSLEEHNRLYRLGRIDLVQVLSAEDAVMNTENSLITYLADYELLILKQAFIRGKVSSFVSAFKE